MKSEMCISNALVAADLIRFPDLHTQELKWVEGGAKEGIFVGRMHMLPCFFDFDMLINPHIFVCGVTGSGKTYLMRSLMVKFTLMLRCLVLLIDFTGEYKEFVQLVGEREASLEEIEHVLENRKTGIIYINLKEKGNERNKVNAASSVLGVVIERMRISEGTDGRVLIVLDEAWKLLKENSALETILREGRKYRHGLLFSSQLIEDMDLGMLSNAASIFIFRLQNKQGLNKLASNYGLKEEEVETIQNLNVGSCMLIQTNSYSKRGLYLIERVQGVDVEKVFKITIGDGMEFDIERNRFEEVIAGLCGKETMHTIMRISEEKGAVKISVLIRLLVDTGSSRRDVLAAMRKIGISDSDIADGFAVAVSNRTNEAERHE